MIHKLNNMKIKVYYSYIIKLQKNIAFNKH